jgi:hypothetical protein
MPDGPDGQSFERLASYPNNRDLWYVRLPVGTRHKLAQILHQCKPTVHVYDSSLFLPSINLTLISSLILPTSVQSLSLAPSQTHQPL